MIENEKVEREKAEKEKKECMEWYRKEQDIIYKETYKPGVRDAGSERIRELNRKMDKKIKDWQEKYLYLYKDKEI